MSRYRIDGSVVDTAKARRTWKEDSYHNGSNFISKATGSEWEHQWLHQSTRGRYYIEAWSQRQGGRSVAYWVSSREAATWLRSQGHDDLPADLACIDVVE
jgi:hypothetical protein